MEMSSGLCLLSLTFFAVSELRHTHFVHCMLNEFIPFCVAQDSSQSQASVRDGVTQDKYILESRASFRMLGCHCCSCILRFLSVLETTNMQIDSSNHFH